MILVQTERQFDAALDVLRTADTIAVDTETYGKRGTPVKHPAQGNRLIGISTHCTFDGSPDYSVSFYFPFRHEADDKVLNLFTQSENLPVEYLPRFAEIFNRPDVRLIFHHMKFDLQILRADGLIFEPNVNNVEDTMAKAQLVDENISHRLKDLGVMAFGEGVDKEEKEIIEIIKKQGGYHKTTPQQMAPYACQDAVLTYNLNPLLDRSLERQGLTGLVRREMKFQTVLAEMEWEGVELDDNLARKLSRRSRNRMREIEDELGFDPSSKYQVAHALFGSPETGGLGIPYTEITKPKSREFPGGVPGTAQEILVGLRNPIAELVLEYRGLQKADSTWYQGWIDRMGHDGRIHPTYNVSEKKEKFGTVTSRLSSFVQQMPRDPGVAVKKLLRPAEGHVMVEYDYSQIEYRLAVSYAGDEDLIEQFRSGADVHQEFADKVGVDRQTAKPTTYAILYGGQGPAVARSLEKQAWINERRIIEIPDEYGQQLVDAYYSLHPKMRQAAWKARRIAEKIGYVTLWNGRMRHFHGAFKVFARKSFNSVLQGGAAQILVEGMNAFHDMRHLYDFRMRIQVHDSLWFEQPLNTFDRDRQIIIETMEWPSKHFPVPFPVDYKIIRYRELDDDSGALLGVGSGTDDGSGSI